MQICYWSRERGELRREKVDRAPVAGEIVTLPDLGLVGQVVQCDTGTAPDGTEELLVELAVAAA